MKTYGEIHDSALQFESDNPNTSISNAYMRGYVDALKSQAHPDERIPVGQPLFFEDITKVPQFEDFWDAYDYKVAHMQSRKMWERLTIAQKHDIMARVPAYVASTTKTGESGKKARMHPATFINPANERWKDEINPITPKPHATTQQLTFAEQSLNGLGKLIAESNSNL